MSDLNAIWGELRSIQASDLHQVYKLTDAIRLLQDNQIDVDQFMDALPTLHKMFPVDSWIAHYMDSIYSLAFTDTIYTTNWDTDKCNLIFAGLSKISCLKPLSLVIDDSLYRFKQATVLHKHLDMFETVKIQSYHIATDMGSSINDQVDDAIKILGKAKNLKKICLSYNDVDIQRLITQHVYFKSVYHFPRLQEIELSLDAWNMWQSYSPQEKASMLQILHQYFVALYHKDCFTVPDEQRVFIGGYQA